MTAEADLVHHLGALEFPGVAEIQPVLRLLQLEAVGNHLAEQAVLVADAVAVAGDAQGGHAFHEAGGQSTEATVTQGGVRFQPADALQVDAEVGQGAAGLFEDAEVGQAVDQQATDEKFQGKVVDPFLAGAIGVAGATHPAVDDVVAGGQGGGLEPVVVEGVVGILADGVGELGEDVGTERGNFVGRDEAGSRHQD